TALLAAVYEDGFPVLEDEGRGGTAVDLREAHVDLDDAPRVAREDEIALGHRVADDHPAALVLREHRLEMRRERRVSLGEPTEPERAVGVAAEKRRHRVRLRELGADLLVQVAERGVGGL